MSYIKEIICTAPFVMQGSLHSCGGCGETEIDTNLEELQLNDGTTIYACSIECAFDAGQAIGYNQAQGRLDPTAARS